METLLTQLSLVNTAYHNKFNNRPYDQTVLTKKHYATLFGKLFQLFQGNVNVANRNRETLLYCFKDYLSNLINCIIIPHLQKYHQDEQFIRAMVQQWQHFKRFTFYYYAIFQHSNEYYQQAYKINQNDGIIRVISDPKSLFPIAVIALKIFKEKVVLTMSERIRKIILLELQKERDNKKVDKEILRTIFQIVWSVELSVQARIKSFNNQIIFYQDQRIQFVKLKTKIKDQHIFKQQLINKIISEAQNHYLYIYQNKIRALNPLDDITTVVKLLEEEKQIANYYLFNNQDRKRYMNAVYTILIEKDIQERMNRNNGIKNILQKFRWDSDDYLIEIKMFFKVLTSNKDATLHIVEKLIKEHILEVGGRINKKISKHKEYIQDVLELKKMINRIIEELMEKDIKICLVRDQSFKKILDSLEASKCLAEYIDLTIKQCIKMKFNQQQCVEMFKNIFLILQNLTAQDCLLIYHQQLLGRRLIDALHEPKTEVQILFLQKLSQKIGTISLSMHMSMIKDIQSSIQISQKYNKMMPFTNFNWNIRIFNPVFWPQSISKSKVQIEPPNYIFKQYSTIQNLYKEQFDYRYLNIKLQRGYSLIEGTLNNTKYRFQGENIYIMILLHISENSNHKLLYGNLKMKFKITKDSQNKNQNYFTVLEKYILVLIENKIILRQNQISSPLNQGQFLSINLKYIPPNKIKPNQVIFIKPSLQMQKQLQQTNVDKAKIMKERQKLIQAALVKVMKHSHSSGNNQITFQQFYLKNFQFSQNTVKERLQQLLALGYCQRDEEDRKIIRYIA